jgi:hypothetical protein
MGTGQGGPAVVPSSRPVELGRVEVLADVIQKGGVAQTRVTLPIVANLDRADRVEPVVEETWLRFEATAARAQAVERADRGDFGGAAATLREAARNLTPYADASPRSAEMARDLHAEAVRLDASEYRVEDRKYHRAVHEAEMKGRGDALSKRRRPPEPR